MKADFYTDPQEETTQTNEQSTQDTGGSAPDDPDGEV